MAKFVTLQTTYRIVTPMFLGGADPNDCAELRPPSIKGLLRFWYRAIDPDYDKNGNEARIFGGSGKGEGQAMFLLRVIGPQRGTEKWPSKNYDGFNAPGPKNGFRYLSFSLKMGDNKRKFIKPGTSFTLQLIFKVLPSTEDRRRILAALWLLGHLGGLGSRARRGFGSLVLEQWFEEGGSWPNLGELPIAASTETAKWIHAFEEGVRTLKGWFQPDGKVPVADHSVLNSNARFYLFKNGYPSGRRTWQKNHQQHSESYDAWEEALDKAGRAMQDFRQRRTAGDPNSDYQRVKAYLLNKAKNPLPEAPPRTAFGLPLTFRYNSLNGEQTTFQGEQHDRSASPLFIRVVEINSRCHPFFVLLDAPLLASGEEIKEQNAGKKDPTWPQPARGVLDDFCDKKLKPIAKEVSW